jgi:sugar lactone lactonase YvrE
VALNTKTFEFNPATGAFTSQLYDLTPGTTYYARAYATNSLGTGYGNEISFTTPAQTVPAIAYGSSSPTPVTLVVGTPANLTLTNTGGMPGREQVSNYVGGNQLTGSTDGIATDAKFSTLRGLAFDGSGNLYVADAGNNRIRKISPAREVSTIAGSSAGYLDGNVTDAKFNEPFDIAADPSGDLYIFDSREPRIRKITSAGVVSTLAGSGTSGFSNGNGTLANFKNYGRLTRDGSGNIYVADYDNHRIRKVTSSGEVTTLAGSGNAANIDGTGTGASLSYPMGICLDGSGNLYVASWTSIRKITSSGVVTTLAGSPSASGFADGTGTEARFWVNGLSAIDADIHGNLYVTDNGNTRIRKISPGGVVTTISGTINGYNNGHISTATYNNMNGLTIDGSGNLYVSSGDGAIRMISNYRIDPALPAGLLFDARTGTITGTPRTTQAAKNYTVYAQNSAGATSTVISITISGLSVINPTAPTNVTSTTAKLNGTVNANGGTTSALTL